MENVEKVDKADKVDKKPGIYTVANFVTVLRVLLAPVVLVLLYSESATWLFVCVGVMVLAELTDMIDGMVARGLNQVSDVGKLLDPLCDSLYRSMIFLGFLALGIMPLWMVVIVVSRDIIVAYTRIIAGLKNIVMGARISGKIKAIFQGVGQIATVVLIALSVTGVEMPVSTIIYWTLFVVTAVTAYSAIDYASTVFASKKS